MLLKIYVKIVEFEEVAYLILNKDLPNTKQLKNLKKKNELIEKTIKNFVNDKKTCLKNLILWMLQELL